MRNHPPDRAELGDVAVGCDEACARCSSYLDRCDESASLDIVRMPCVLAADGSCIRVRAVVEQFPRIWGETLATMIRL